MTDAPNRPLKVFLCHASADKPAVRDLYKRLVADGVDAWLDAESLIPGQNWWEEIQKAIRASDVVIVCLSEKSVNKEGVVQKEIKSALDVADEKPEGTIFIIPARLEECQTPYRLSLYHWVDLFEENGYQKMMRALRLRADKIGAVLQIKKSQPPKNEKPEPTQFKLNMAIIIALIGFTGTILVVLISLPMLANLFSSTPYPVRTSSPTIMLTLPSVTNSLLPTEIFTLEPTSIVVTPTLLDAASLTPLPEVPTPESGFTIVDRQDVLTIDPTPKTLGELASETYYIVN
jgi:hypothetical protein